MSYSLKRIQSELHYLLLSTIAIMSLIGSVCFYQKMYISMLLLLPLSIFTILAYLSNCSLKKNKILYTIGATQYIIISSIFITVSEILNLISKSDCKDYLCEILNPKFAVLAVVAILSIFISLYGRGVLVRISRASMKDRWAKSKKEFDLKNLSESKKKS